MKEGETGDAPKNNEELISEEIAEYERIIGYPVSSNMKYGALHRRILRLYRELTMGKFHKRCSTDTRFRSGYSNDIKRIVRQLINVRNLKERVEERLVKGERCERCWYCCTSRTLPSELDNKFFPFKKDLVWLRIWIRCGLNEVKYIRHKPSWPFLVMTKFQYCQLLGIDNEYRPTCLIYEDRPDVCREFECWE